MNFTEHIRRHAIQNDRKIKKVCQPLEAIGIDSFWYITISPSGEFTYLGNIGHIAEYFFDQGLYKGHPSFRAPHLIQPGVELLMEDQKGQQLQEPVRKEFLLDQICMFNFHENGEYHGCGFGTRKNQHSLNGVYLNQQNELKKFIRHFRTECDVLFESVRKNRVDIAQLIGDIFYEHPNQKESTWTHGVLELNSLSAQELACFKLLLKGRTAQQTGDALSLSKRTVEHYLETVKIKLGCYSKQELFDYAYDNFLISLDLSK